jgi:hypothetical protein
VECAGSGFGISVKDGMAYRFIAFDDAGSTLASKIAMTTKKEKDIRISVLGYEKDGFLVVQRISEAM